MPSLFSETYCIRSSMLKISDFVKGEDLNWKIPKQGLYLRSDRVLWEWYNLCSDMLLTLVKGTTPTGFRQQELALCCQQHTILLKKEPQPYQSKIYPCVKVVWFCPKKTLVCFFFFFLMCLLFVKFRAYIATAMKEAQIHFH